MDKQKPQPLTPIQIKLIEGLLEGKSVPMAALAAGCSRRTAFYWLRSGPVHDEYERLREQAVSDFQKQLKELQGLALKSMKDVLTNKRTPPYVRLGVMKMIWEASFAPDWHVGQPTPVVDALASAIEEVYDEQQQMGHINVVLYDDRGRERLNEDGTLH